jgi:transposase
MPERQFITGIAGVEVIDVQEQETYFEIRGVAKVTEGLRCQWCDSQRYRIKSSRERELKHGIWNHKLVRLLIRIPKLYCRTCCRYFTLRLPGILPKKRSTEQFRKSVFHSHHGGISQTHLARTHFVSASSVERWYQDYVAYRVKERDLRQCPLVMGIDEHFFGRKDGYATTLVDWGDQRSPSRII